MARPLLLLLIVSLCCVTSAGARQEAEEDNARGVFIRTRRKSLRQKAAVQTVPLRPRRPVGRRPQRRPAPPAEVAEVPTPSARQRLVGLGYTLYLKNDEGRFVSVNPNRTFRTGQAVRLQVESNVDGYLYVLHQENDGPAQLMFPCSLAWGGDNRIRAHKPLFISPTTEIRFTGGPAVETLTLIVSRRPLPLMPGAHQLAEGRCSTPISWSELDSVLRRPCQCSRDLRVAEGQRMPADTTARDMEMVASDAEPHHIFVNRQPADDILIARVALTHR